MLWTAPENHADITPEGDPRGTSICGGSAMQTFFVGPAATTGIATTVQLPIDRAPMGFYPGYREKCLALSGNAVLLAEDFQCVLMQAGDTSGQTLTRSVPEPAAVKDPSFEANTGE